MNFEIIEEQKNNDGNKNDNSGNNQNNNQITDFFSTLPKNKCLFSKFEIWKFKREFYYSCKMFI